MELIQKKKSILVVDEDPYHGKSLDMHLRRQGFYVKVAFDEKVAKKEVVSRHDQEKHLDLVIIDLMMPKKDGTNLVSWIKKNYPTLPLLIISGFNKTEQVDKILTPGIDLFLKKPLNPKIVLEAIKSLLRKVNRKTTYC